MTSEQRLRTGNLRSHTLLWLLKFDVHFSTEMSTRLSAAARVGRPLCRVSPPVGSVPFLTWGVSAGLPFAERYYMNAH
jgi:hypothetical protein